MKKLALAALLALEIAVCGCGNSTTPNTTNTEAKGNWEAQLRGGTDQAALLNFVTSFTVTNSGPLDITGFGFFNSGACFSTGATAETESGTANFTTSSTNTVNGTLDLTITSTTNGNVLTLNGTLTGTSNGTTTTTGTLSNGVVVGTWTLQTSDPKCTGAPTSNNQGTFLMCQDKNTCTPTTSAAVISAKKPN
jgi:hypothetical protein